MPCLRRGISRNACGPPALLFHPEGGSCEKSITFENSSMGIELGHISAIFRYTIKSMAGTRLDSAKIGWHGVEGDRRIGVWTTIGRRTDPRVSGARPPDAVPIDT